MKQKRFLSLLLPCLGMLLLVLDSRTALQSAAIGIDLCLRTVIPSLLPFFLITNLLTGAALGIHLPGPLGRWMGLPPGAEPIFLAGLLGGYPMGIALTASHCRSGQLSPKVAFRMVAFCNNAGPAFLFGMAGALFSAGWIPWALWGIQILSAVITAFLLTGVENTPVRLSAVTQPTLPQALNMSLRSMAQVCGWVVIFRVLLGFAQRWCLWLLPPVGQIIAGGLLELSNGCCSLAYIGQDGLRMILCAGFLTFGGLCVAMQTASLSAGLDLRLYLPGKVFQGCLAVSFACLAVALAPDLEKPGALWDVFLVFLLLALVWAGILRKIQKSSSICDHHDV